MNTEKEQECLIMLNGQVIGKMKGVNIPVNFTVMNDETYLLEHQRQNPEEVDEILQAHREHKVRKAASDLVSEMLKAEGDKSFWGWWRRVARAEKQALVAAGMLKDQALNLKSAQLCAFWCSVRIVIRERSYL